MAFPLDKQADFITVSWQNKIKKKNKQTCESPVENFGDRNRTAVIWLHIFYDTEKEINRKVEEFLQESLENLCKYKIQQANGISTVYSGSTNNVYSDNGQGECPGWCLPTPAPCCQPLALLYCSCCHHRAMQWDCADLSSGTSHTLTLSALAVSLEMCSGLEQGPKFIGLET